MGRQFLGRRIETWALSPEAAVAAGLVYRLPWVIFHRDVDATRKRLMKYHSNYRIG